eukprot:1317296-Rhodomonas_salina.1
MATKTQQLSDPDRNFAHRQKLRRNQQGPGLRVGWLGFGLKVKGGGSRLGVCPMPRKDALHRTLCLSVSLSVTVSASVRV